MLRVPGLKSSMAVVDSCFRCTTTIHSCIDLRVGFIYLHLQVLPGMVSCKAGTGSCQPGLASTGSRALHLAGPVPHGTRHNAAAAYSLHSIFAIAYSKRLQMTWCQYDCLQIPQQHPVALQDGGAHRSAPRMRWRSSCTS